MPGRVRYLLAAMAAVVMLAAPAAAQDMTASDLTTLQQTADEIDSELVQLRQRDRAQARALQAELLDLEEEITYLKVKMRKEPNGVSRAEYSDLRSRLDNLRSRVRGEATTSSTSNNRSSSSTNARDSSSTQSETEPGTLPAGTELDVRLSDRLSSDTARVEDRFEATTVVDVRQNGQVIIPAGSVVRGVVTAVSNAGRLERTGRLTLSFDQIRVNGRTYPIRGTVTQALESGGYREDAGKIGTGAAVGAILGGILGGVRGALTGVLIGGGGVVAATEGQDVELPAGTVLRMRLDEPLKVQTGR
jgi:hypothetical protein